MTHAASYLAIAFALLGIPPQESDETRLNEQLALLGDLARRIDSGQTTLVDARKSGQQPDKAMQAIRDLLHRDPGLSAHFLEFIRSESSPLAPRVIAVIALSQPERQELIVMLGSLLEDAPNVHLAQAVFRGFQTARPPGGRDEWRSELLESLGSLGCGAGYRS